jgi:hypothetical protein
MTAGRHAMVPWTKVAIDERVSEEELLGLVGRLEALLSRCRLDGSSISLQAGAGPHPYVDGGIKRDENISTLGIRAEPVCHRR